jgi:redox-sensitive bicupin YhaK (pirin superfamily)
LNKLRLVASGDGAEGSVKINQDARIYSSLLEPDQQVAYALAAGRYGWLQVARGALQITGSTGKTHSLSGGDAVAVHALTDGTAQTITLTGKPDQGTTTEILWFDLP